MTVIGRVTYEADIDGKKLPAVARTIGRKMGKAATGEFSKAFEDDLSTLGNRIGTRMMADWRRNGNDWGFSLGDSMRNAVSAQLGKITDDVADALTSDAGWERWARNFDSPREAVDKLSDSLGKLRTSGAATWNEFQAGEGEIRRLQRALDESDASARLHRESMNQLSIDLAEMGRNATIAEHGFEGLDGAQRDATVSLRQANDETDRSVESHKRARRALDGHAAGWSGMSHNARQWTLIIGAIMAAGEDIAVLGSGLGSSLTILGGAFTSVALGAGTAFAAFKNLGDEVSTLPAEIQPAAEAFQSIGDAFGVMQDKIEAAALSGAAPAFESLRATVEGLTPAFESLGAIVGSVLGEFAASIAPGTAGFENLRQIIEASGPVFQTLSQAAMTFGEALGNVFVLAMPFVQEFAEWISEIGSRFLEWSQSDAGREAITQWFENGQQIMSALLPVIEALSQALNSMVTPESIASFTILMDAVAQLVPILGQIIETVGQMGILQLFVDLLIAVGQSIEPLLPFLVEFGQILAEGIMTAVAALVPLFQQLFTAIGPLLPIIAQLASDLLEALMPVLPPLVEVFVQLVNAIVPLLPSISELIVLFADHLARTIVELIPIVIPLIEQFVEMAEVIAPILPIVVDLIAIALEPLHGIFVLLAPVITFLIQLVLKLANPFIDLLRPLTENKKAFDDVSNALDGFRGVMRSVTDSFAGWGSTIEGVLDGVISAIEDAIGWFADLFNASANAGSVAPGGGGGGGGVGRSASGGVFTSAQKRLIGESGVELVVPMQRALSQVDPRVREVAAFAQGKLDTGSGRSLYVAEGAIVVQTGVADPRMVASIVLDDFISGYGEI